MKELLPFGLETLRMNGARSRVRDADLPRDLLLEGHAVNEVRRARRRIKGRGLPRPGRQHARPKTGSLDSSPTLCCSRHRAYYTEARRKVVLMKTPEQRDLFPGALEMMILRTLKRQPLHGYALAQHIKRTSNDLLQIEGVSLYPALQRLLKTELVNAEWGISSTNRRVRIYKVTAAGAKLLSARFRTFSGCSEELRVF